MSEVKVLKEGYSKWIAPGRQHADGTITLIKGKHNVIVDTGIPQDKNEILEKLKQEHANPDDIHLVLQYYINYIRYYWHHFFMYRD